MISTIETNNLQFRQIIKVQILFVLTTVFLILQFSPYDSIVLLNMFDRVTVRGNTSCTDTGLLNCLKLFNIMFYKNVINLIEMVYLKVYNRCIKVSI